MTHAIKTRREEGKGIKNVASLRDAASVLQYLNEQTGKNFRAVDANLKLIAARLDEGASLDDCKSVIDSKLVQWGGDPKMREYLRPATLFSATKFAQYAGEGATSIDQEATWE